MKEHKIIKVFLKTSDVMHNNYEKLESVMDDMSAQGWDVVCVTNEPSKIASTEFLVAFSREVERFPNAKNYNIDIK